MEIYSGELFNINYWAVLVAAVAPMLIGSAWYSPALFARSWMKAVGKTEADIKKGATGKLYFLAFAASLITSFVTAHLVDIAGATSIIEGVILGFWVWLGYVATVTATNHLFEGRSKKLYLINVGYHLVSLMAMAIILSVWA